MNGRIPLLMAAMMLLGGGSRALGADAFGVHCVGGVLLDKACEDAHSLIQDAIDHAEAGETVLVAAGAYFERVAIRKDGIKLLGAAGPDGEPVSVLDATHLPAPTSLLAIENARGVEVANFRFLILNGHEWSIHFDNAESSSLHDLRIDAVDCRSAEEDCGAITYGVSLRDEADNRIDSTVIFENGRADEGRWKEEELIQSLTRNVVRTQAALRDAGR